MHRIFTTCAGLGLLATLPVAAVAGTTADTLTAQRVVALARTRAHPVRLAESQVIEARARLSGARALAGENPTVEAVASAGQRVERRTQWEAVVPLGLGPARSARIGEARAELEREGYRLADARRGAAGAALAAFYRVLHAERRIDLARERRTLAGELRKSAEQRHRAGDAPRLELLLAENEEHRAESGLSAERRAVALERLALAAWLGAASGESLRVRGELADRAILALASEPQGEAPRADLRAAESEVRAARAARRLAGMDWFPSLAFRLHYGHEDGEPIVRPGLGVTVPLFRRGQEEGGQARAREERARAELDRARAAAAAEREGLAVAYHAAVAAADQLERHALPRVRESEGMAEEAYRAGKVDLTALLIVRRDLLETRREHLDRLLDAALAGIDLAVARGRFQ